MFWSEPVGCVPAVLCRGASTSGGGCAEADRSAASPALDEDTSSTNEDEEILIKPPSGAKPGAKATEKPSGPPGIRSRRPRGADSPAGSPAGSGASSDSEGDSGSKDGSKSGEDTGGSWSDPEGDFAFGDEEEEEEEEEEEDLDALFMSILEESKRAEESARAEDAGAEALVSKYKAELAARARATPSEPFKSVFNPPRDGDCLMRCAVEHDFGGSGAGMTADMLRLAVVARARARTLKALGEKSKEAEYALRQCKPNGPKRQELELKIKRLKGAAVAEVKARFDTMSRPGVVMGEDELQGLADARGAPVEV